jgi:hypothetical protein
VKTGVQEIGKALKTLDSGFRRNDVKKTQIDFFTPSPFKGGNGGIPADAFLKKDEWKRGGFIRKAKVFPD